MEVHFRSRRLQRCAESTAQAIRTWGSDVGVRYVQRLEALVTAPNLDAIYATRAFDFHPLTGNRAGQHALRLTGQMRMIVTVEDERTIWIEEVVDYHG